MRAIKIGMLASPAIARALASAARRAAGVAAAAGCSIRCSPPRAARRSFTERRTRPSPPSRRLWTRALLTPNALEAQALLGLEPRRAARTSWKRPAAPCCGEARARR